jgi:hypothetical protein
MSGNAGTLTLYELGEEQQALDALVGMDEGEWTDDHEVLAQELTARLVLKADAFGAFVGSLTATADAIKVEQDRLAARRKAIENTVARLKRYALQALQTMDRDKITGTLYTLGVQRNPPSVQVDVSAEGLADEYVRIVPATRDINKTAIGAALKAGAEIPGCSLTTTYSLRIR